MFKLENNSKKDKKIINFFTQIEEKVKRNKTRIIALYIGFALLAFFGQEVFGDWFYGFSEFLKAILGVILYITFSYWTHSDKRKKDDLKENNFEKEVDDSSLKNIADTIIDHETNKNEIIKNSIGDINNSAEEWKIKIFLLIFLGVVISFYFAFAK